MMLRCDGNCGRPEEPESYAYRAGYKCCMSACGGTWREVATDPSPTPKLDAWKAAQDVMAFAAGVTPLSAFEASMVRDLMRLRELLDKSGDDNAKLQEQNAALQLNEHDLQEENARLRDTNSKQANTLLYGDHTKALREENSALKERLARHKEDCNDQRLRMELADVKTRAARDGVLCTRTLAELDWYRDELRRMNPTLVAAHEKNRGMANSPPLPCPTCGRSR